MSVEHILYVCLDWNLMQPHTACGEQVTFSLSRLFSSMSNVGNDGGQRRLGEVAGV